MPRKKPSPTMQLLTLVWHNQGYQMGPSWERLNSAMRMALSLAVSHGLRFDVGDFKRIADSFRPEYWMNREAMYSRACNTERDHGPNMSAALAFEKWTARKPFLIQPTPQSKSRIRVAVGSQFKWYAHPELLIVECTSFANGQDSFTACAYKWIDRTRKVSRRFRITHDKIAEYHAEIRKRLKEPADA